jgi:alkylation response protein AidB-like acyl-CoA dehydrogenase
VSTARDEARGEPRRPVPPDVAQQILARDGTSTEDERQQWFPRVEAGVVFGNAITDAHGKAPSSADTTLLADGNGTLRLNGYKFYSTGTLFADVIAVSASMPRDATCRRSCPPTAPVSSCSTTGTVSGNA